MAPIASYSGGVDVLKLDFTQYEKFYNGLIQQNATESILMLIDVID